MVSYTNHSAFVGVAKVDKGAIRMVTFDALRLHTLTVKDCDPAGSVQIVVLVAAARSAEPKSPVVLMFPYAFAFA